MWEFLEPICLYLHSKKKTVIPLILLGVSLLVYLALMFFTPRNTSGQVSLQADPLISAPSVLSQRPFPSPKPTVVAKKPLSSQAHDHVPAHRGSENVIPEQYADRVSNGETVRNYTQFDDNLREVLMERFGETLSRNLSHRILLNLSQGETSMEVLDKTILEEMPDAPLEVRLEVRDKVHEALSKIAHPNP